MTHDQPEPSGHRLSMGARPMLTALHIKAAANAFMAAEALERSEDEGGPDPAEAKDRLGRIIRLLLWGEE